MTDEIAAIIHAAPSIIKNGAELVGALKLTEITKAILGDATAEFADRLRDEVRLYRFGNQRKSLKKAEKMVEDAGFTPRAVPIKLLFPLLEGASLEEDESLHDMWAALLANAASPNNLARVRPGFIATLKQMDPQDAVLLKMFGDENKIPVTNKNEFRRYGLDEAAIFADVPIKTQGEIMERLRGQTERRLSLHALIAQQLVQGTYWFRHHGLYTEIDRPIAVGDCEFTYTLTAWGRAFVGACAPPEP